MTTKNSTRTQEEAQIQAEDLISDFKALMADAEISLRQLQAMRTDRSGQFAQRP